MTDQLPQVELTGAGLLLRPFPAHGTPARLEDLRIGLSDPEQARWNPRAFLKPPTDEEINGWLGRLADGWASGSIASWSVLDPESGQLLGQVAIREIVPLVGTGRVGYWTMPAARGRGVASGALAAASRWAFEQAGLHRVELAHAVDHHASCRIAERSGYQLEGVLREAMPDTYGRRHDLHLHARLAIDPAPSSL